MYEIFYENFKNISLYLRLKYWFQYIFFYIRFFCSLYLCFHPFSHGKIQIIFPDTFTPQEKISNNKIKYFRLAGGQCHVILYIYKHTHTHIHIHIHICM